MKRTLSALPVIAVLLWACSDDASQLEAEADVLAAMINNECTKTQPVFILDTAESEAPDQATEQLLERRSDSAYAGLAAGYRNANLSTRNLRGVISLGQGCRHLSRAQGDSVLATYADAFMPPLDSAAAVAALVDGELLPLVVSFSRVGFSDNGTRAVVRRFAAAGPFCIGEYMILTDTADNWQITDTEQYLIC